MALPQITYPAYVLTSSTDANSAQITLSVGREAELIGLDGADHLATLLVNALAELTGAQVNVTKYTLTEGAFTP